MSKDKRIQRTVDLQYCLFDLHIPVIPDGKYSSRFRDCHSKIPFQSAASLQKRTEFSIITAIIAENCTTCNASVREF